MQTSELASEAPKKAGDGGIVLRNSMYLGLAEVLVIPISVVLNGMMGRYLGPEDMGSLYLATMITRLAGLGIEWGHPTSLPATVVRDKENAGRLLGSSIAWRLVASVLAYVIVTAGCHLLGFNAAQQWAIGLTFLGATITTCGSAFQDVIRGFERTDVAAYSRVGSQLLTVFLVMPVLLLGGKLRPTLLAQAAAAVFVFVAVWRAARGIGIHDIGWDKQRWKELMSRGTPFVFFGLALVLQPNLDAFFLAKLSPASVVGCYAVVQKLIGFLLVPATALVGALYPTLFRLAATDAEGFQRTTRNALGAVSLVVVPVALGCALYADVGVSIFGREAFAPAEDTLRLCAIFLFLVYFSMPIGVALIASGFQRVWTIIQLVCVGVSAILDPILIPYFQANHGNGSLGLAISLAVSESLMVIAGIVLLPRGFLERGILKTIALSVLSGGAMAGAALALRGIPSLLAAPISVIAYAIAVYVTGAVSKDQTEALTGFLRRKLKRG